MLNKVRMRRYVNNQRNFVNKSYIFDSNKDDDLCQSNVIGRIRIEKCTKQFFDRVKSKFVNSNIIAFISDLPIRYIQYRIRKE